MEASKGPPLVIVGWGVADVALARLILLLNELFDR